MAETAVPGLSAHAQLSVRAQLVHRRRSLLLRTRAQHLQKCQGMAGQGAADAKLPTKTATDGQDGSRGYGSAGTGEHGTASQRLHRRLDPAHKEYADGPGIHRPRHVTTGGLDKYPGST